MYDLIAVIVNSIGVILAAASLPLVWRLRSKPGLAYLPWIIVGILLQLFTAIVVIQVGGVDLHHYVELLLVGLVMVFAFNMLKQSRWRR